MEGLAQGLTAKPGFWKEMHNNANNVGSFLPFCLKPESPGGWGGLDWRPGGLGDMTLECVGETRRLLLQARQANRPTCGRNGLWLSATASVSFGLSTPATKCPQRVRLDKDGKVRGQGAGHQGPEAERWPRNLLLCPLPKGSGGQWESPFPGGTPNFSGGCIDPISR